MNQGLIKKLILLGIFLFSIRFIYAQDINNISAGVAKIIAESNLDALSKIANEKSAKAKLDKAAGILAAQRDGMPAKGRNTKGATYEVVGITPEGKPLYYVTDNANAAITTGANKLRTGGSLGLNLNGENMYNGIWSFLAEWDAGVPKAGHQEFNATGGSVVVNKDLSADDEYGTHVGGTMVAFGVTASARGMANKAKLDAYDWNSDESEMATAAANGLLVSNHSYGSISGWDWTDYSGTDGWHYMPSYYTSSTATEERNFGQYNSTARDWDNICVNAPYYLPVKSAGNDRGDGPTAGETFYVYNGSAWVSKTAGAPANDGGSQGYDCIPTYGNAKNVLTVGAVNDVLTYTSRSSVIMSTFSGWGPTDDGRIKPDICGNGVGVYSSTNTSNTSYGIKSGTSMSSPNVSGSIILLQQHYRNLSGGNFMRSATLKGLVIHTAREAGANPGPDYAFGWGLLDAEAAANAITANFAGTGSFLRERTLANNQRDTLRIIANGQPLSTTIC